METTVNTSVSKTTIYQQPYHSHKVGRVIIVVIVICFVLILVGVGLYYSNTDEFDKDNLGWVGTWIHQH